MAFSVPVGVFVLDTYNYTAKRRKVRYLKLQRIVLETFAIHIAV